MSLILDLLDGCIFLKYFIDGMIMPYLDPGFIFVGIKGPLGYQRLFWCDHILELHV